MGNTMIEDKFIHIKNQPIKVDANIKSQMGTSDDPVRVKSVGGAALDYCRVRNIYCVVHGRYLQPVKNTQRFIS